DYNPPGIAEAFRTTALAGGTVTRLTVYVDTGSTGAPLVAGLYGDSGGHPAGLLASGSLASPVPGAWNDVAIPAASVTAGAVYWRAVLSPGGTLRYRDR